MQETSGINQLCHLTQKKGIILYHSKLETTNVSYGICPRADCCVILKKMNFIETRGAYFSIRGKFKIAAYAFQ